MRRFRLVSTISGLYSMMGFSVHGKEPLGYIKAGISCPADRTSVFLEGFSLLWMKIALKFCEIITIMDLPFSKLVHFGTANSNSTGETQTTSSLSLFAQLFLIKIDSTVLKAAQKDLLSAFFTNDKIVFAPEWAIDKALFTGPALYSLSPQKSSAHGENRRGECGQILLTKSRTGRQVDRTPVTRIETYGPCSTQWMTRAYCTH